MGESADMMVRYQIGTLAAVLAACGSAAAISVPLPSPDAGVRQSAAPQPGATTIKAAPKKLPRYVFTFTGRGYGHGIGMSQYGAYGAALAGRTAEQIIAHYYRGTTLTTLPVTPVRVLLRSDVSSLELSANGAWNATREGVALGGTRALPAGRITVTREGAAIVVTDSAGAELLRSEQALRFAPAAAPTLVALSGARYRGEIRVIRDGSALTAINHVDLEQYLPGVVPREMPASWGNAAPAALQAQAIAARSYAMATKRTGGVFDMYPDERSQVYGGVGAEDPRTNIAVAATSGKVVTLDGEIVTTFFFSTSGGMTENVEHVFSPRPLSYLVAVSDAEFDRLSPHHVWRDPKTFTDGRLAKLVGLKSPVLRIKVLARGASPRVKVARFYARNGTFKDVKGTTLRSILGLRDTWFVPKRRVRTPATLRLVTEHVGDPAIAEPGSSVEPAVPAP